MKRRMGKLNKSTKVNTKAQRTKVGFETPEILRNNSVLLSFEQSLGCMNKFFVYVDHKT